MKKQSETLRAAGLVVRTGKSNGRRYVQLDLHLDQATDAAA